MECEAKHVLKRTLKSLRGHPIRDAGAVSSLEVPPGKMPEDSSSIQIGDLRKPSIRMFLDIPRLYLLKWGHEVGV